MSGIWTEENVRDHVERMIAETKRDVENGVLHIDPENRMVPVNLREEMTRKIRNEIAWSQRHRRVIRGKIRYFRGMPDSDESAQRILADLEPQVEDLTVRENLYKAELTKWKEGT